jgi:fructose-1,6-bisphosphatase I
MSFRHLTTTRFGEASRDGRMDMPAATLDAYLNTFTSGNDPVKIQIAETIRAFSAAAVLVRKSINEGALGAAFAGTRGSANAGGDTQKELDVHADNLFLEGARKAGIAYYASEELANPVAINPDSKIAVAIDPLDGSSNIDTNVSIGTIFSILPCKEDAAATFSQPGTEQLAAGFFIYGPQMALVLTKRNGTRIFVFSSRLGTFVEAYPAVAIPPMASEFAINTSNYRHWDEPTRLYIDDCLAGTEGPREKDFNMRWIASLVADTYRILIRGGVFLYPRDNRKGYSQGRSAAGLRSQSDRTADRRGGRHGDRRDPPHPRNRTGRRASAHSACLRLQEGSRENRPLPDQSLGYRHPPSAVHEPRPVPGLNEKDQEQCLTSIPIIAITGSSGAGTTTVKDTFGKIFNREGVTAAFIEGDAFHRYDRAGMKKKVAEEEKKGNDHFSHFSPEANELEILESVFEEYGRKGKGKTRHYVHDDHEAEVLGAPPGTFTEWEDLPESDLLFYEGLHGCIKTGKVDLPKHVDLKIGVVPVINLEWIQKIHRDKSMRGYSTEAVTETILRRMPDYARYICPQFSEPTSTSSASRRSTRRTRS